MSTKFFGLFLAQGNEAGRDGGGTQIVEKSSQTKYGLSLEI